VPLSSASLGVVLACFRSRNINPAPPPALRYGLFLHGISVACEADCVRFFKRHRLAQYSRR
jgi:hypothetical protein